MDFFESHARSAIPSDCQCLEDRVLYSAVPLDLVAEPVDWSDAAQIDDVNLDPQDLARLQTVQPDSTTERQSQAFSDLWGFDSAGLDSYLPNIDQDSPIDEIQHLVFINHDVEDFDQLISELQNNSVDYQVYVLNNELDGVWQVTEILANHTNVASLHFVTHGSDGQISLGNSSLTLDNLQDYEDELRLWNNQLRMDADILFYGCDVAASAIGEQFVDSLAKLTSADIAASEDVTGHASLYGNWVLEYQSGIVETEIVFNSQVQQQWWGSLATYVVTSTADDGSAGTLRWAIDQANLNAGDDTIAFNIPDADGGHVYYQDDGIAGSLSLIATTTTDDAFITDFDPDYPFSPHSWFQIDLNNALPQLTVTDTLFIDGYSQSGATQNTLTIGQNANLLIELTNSAADSNRGLTFNTGANGSILQGLAINDFGGLGVLVNYDVHGVTVQGNFLGTDITGTLDVGNGGGGIQIRSNDNLVGGSDVADRNIISGNDSRGVVFFQTVMMTGNVVENNYIGVDATGINGLGNNVAGIQLYNNDGVQVIDNVIADNATSGIWFRAGADVTNATVQGNMIGVGADGTTILGNGAEGILVESNSATNNLIGGNSAGEGNIIGGNSSHGISFAGSGVSDNFVYGNSIGTDAAGVLNLANGGSGVLVVGGSLKQTIGGVSPGQANTIAFNNLDGVAVLSGFGTVIRGNAIHSNGDLGIDLIGNNGVNANDANDGDGGANNLQNFPVLISAVIDGSDITIDGTFNSTPLTNNFVIDFYWSLSGDVSGHGEAENYLGSVLVNTNASGNAIISHTLLGANVPANAFVTATATDPGLNTSEFSQTVETDSIPVITNNGGGDNTAISVAENTSAVTIVAATDDDLPADTLTYNITGGADAALFTINTSTGQLDFISARDFETFTDADSDGTYEVQVTVDDGSLTDVQDISVTITDVNEAPMITSNGGGATAAVNVAEGLTAVTDVEANDEDVPADTLTYNITGGADAALFTINSSTGQLDFVSARDFETFTDANSDGTYEVQVTVDDGSLTDVQDISVTITDVNEAPMITSNGGGATATVNVVENTTAVTFITATDEDVPADTLTYNITGGVDAALFTINSSTGQLDFIAPKDFETFEDANSDGVYEVEVTVDDGNSGTDIQQISVTVTDNNENPTTSGIVDQTVNEDATDLLLDLRAVFDDAEDLDSVMTYSIENVTNPSLFSATTIDGSDNLVLDFAPDQHGATFITVRATDSGGLFVETTFQVTVTPVNDNPIVNNQSFGIDENSANGTSVGFIGADPGNLDAAAGDTITDYSILGGSGISVFAVDSLTGEITVIDNSSLDFESTTTFTLDVVVTDAGTPGLADSATITISLNDLNEAPTIVSFPSTSAENNLVVGTVTASDVDSLPLTYSIGGGVDGGLFGIDPVSGELSFLTAADFESPSDADANNTYEVVVDVTDSDGLIDSQLILINVTNVLESPTAVDDAFSVDEGATYNSVIGEVSINDFDTAGNLFTVALIAGPANGALTLGADGSFDYVHDGGETVSDSFQYAITNADGMSDSATVSITVNPVQDPTVVADDYTSAASGVPVSLTPAELLSNDFDIDSSSFVVQPVPGSEIGGSVTVDGSGNLVFTPTSGFTGSASFAYIVIADGETSAPATVVIEVGAVPTTPPSSGPDPDPPSEPKDEVEDVLAAPPIKTADSIDSTANEPPATTKIEPLFASVTFDNSESTDKQVDDIALAQTNFFYFSTDTRENQDGSRVNKLQFLDPSVVTAAGWLWSDLNQLSQRMAAEGSLASFWTIATPSLATSISVGYVMWLIKGGQIMAGLMAQVPAWRLINIDPLPIISAIDDSDSEIEGDSLASMVDEAAEKPHPPELVTNSESDPGWR